ncbi:MAG: bacillithiol system redox-active protein YtxJ [Bacteroidia bacterium]
MSSALSASHYWQDLNSTDQIDGLIEESKNKPVAIFKHSIRCGISHHVKDRIESDYDIKPNELSFYYLDLITNRPVSNRVADVLNVPHQSPQLILLKDGDVVYDASHHMINLNHIRTHLREL